MVRTSDFQSENVGSTPSNPIILKFSNINKLTVINNKNINNKNINFTFSFISLISPFILNNIRFSFNTNNIQKKILLKQSYILLTWFYYLTFIEQTVNNKNKLKFFICPVKIQKFTLTKAPMAHKNWSKEQYKFQYFNFIINFNVFLKDDNNVNSLNKCLLFIFLTKKTFPQFETNLFFLKNIKIYLYLQDLIFFNYYKFFIK